MNKTSKHIAVMSRDPEIYSSVRTLNHEPGLCKANKRQRVFAMPTIIFVLRLFAISDVIGYCFCYIDW